MRKLLREVVSGVRLRSRISDGSSAPPARSDPVEAPKPISTADEERIAPHFDPVFYLKNNPDVAAAGIDPLHHFCTYGWREGRDPNAKFSVGFYTANNPDVANSGQNPFLHYLMSGEAEGRKATPDHLADNENAIAAAEEEWIKPHFDAKFYLESNSDVTVAGESPLAHFCIFGWREGRDPNREFSTKYYLENNPDVASAGINPFLHYVMAGKNEGRLPRHPGGYRYDLLAQQVPLEKVVQQWANDRLPSTLLTERQIIHSITGDLEDADQHLLISVGHDHYRRVPGGVQLCIHREELLATSLGKIYVNIHPWQPLPVLAHNVDDLCVNIVVDGKDRGVARMQDFISAVEKISLIVREADVIIHHMLGHAPEQLADLIMATRKKKVTLWLHDFFTLCPSYALLRNNVKYCGAPSIDSNACTICLFGKARAAHLQRIRSFFKKIDVSVIAPSSAALALWEQANLLTPYSKHVVPHARFVPAKKSIQRPGKSNGRIRVAFAGAPVVHKGWPLFAKLVGALKNDPRLEFFYFGSHSPSIDGLKCEHISVAADDLNSMSNAIAQAQIDIVIHWAECFETFSFTTHEAICGGSIVITNAKSGNVANVVRATKHGVVLADEYELWQFFEDTKLSRFIERQRSRIAALPRQTLRWSDMSFSLLGK